MGIRCKIPFKCSISIGISRFNSLSFNCLFYFCVDYEQVNADSGDENNETNHNRKQQKQRKLLSSPHKASTSISNFDVNDCDEPLNIDSEQIINMGTNVAPPIANDESNMANNWDKFCLLLWKNSLLQWRHKVQTVIEILVPVLFSVILILIRSMVDPTFYPNSTEYKPFAINTLQPLRLVSFNFIELFCFL